MRQFFTARVVHGNQVVKDAALGWLYIKTLITHIKKSYSVIIVG